MEYTIDDGPSYATVDVTLDAGEQLQTRPGVMLDRTAGIQSESSVGGGEGLTGLAKRAVSDERGLVDNRYTATADGDRITIVPDFPGDVAAFQMGQVGDLRVQSAGLLGWEPLVERTTRSNQFGNFFASGELTVLGLAGRGTAFVSAFGSLLHRSVTPDAPLVVDEDHLVAWSAPLSLTRQNDGSLKSTILGGEGRVTRVEGTGDVWLQTRNPTLLLRPAPNDSGGGY